MRPCLSKLEIGFKPYFIQFWQTRLHFIQNQEMNPMNSSKVEINFPNFPENFWYLLLSIYFFNIANFFAFLKKTHVYTMFVIEKFFSWAWKSLKNAHCLPGKGYISCPQVIYLHFSSEKSCFERIFIFSLPELYLYNDFNQKIIHKVV